jgi:creatinine amidohydrolase
MKKHTTSRREALKQIGLLSAAGTAATLGFSDRSAAAQDTRTIRQPDKKVLYEELLPDEFIERINECPIAYLPLGTLEWHGLHLPLGADGIQSRDFFIALAEKMGGIVLPMLFLGPDLIKKSPDHDDTIYVGMDFYSFEDDHMQQLEGTAYYIEWDLFNKVVEAILWNLSRAGFKIVVAHGHGPSTGVVGKNSEKYEEKFGLKLFELWDLCGHGNDGVQTDHAAFNETSLVMGLRPDLVDLEKISRDQDMIGIWGTDPRTTASYEEGKRIIDKNLLITEEKLKKELSKIHWIKREINHSNVKKLYKRN